MYPTDGNDMIYGIPENYTVNVTCNNEIAIDYKLYLQFSEEWYIIENFRCIVGTNVSDYSCYSNNLDQDILIEDFTDDVLPALEQFSFTIEAIRNPGVFDTEHTVTIQTLTSLDKIVDEGSYTFASTYFQPGNITTFTI